MIHGLPWWNWVLQIVGISMSYFGAILNTRMDIRGFYVWLFSNTILLILHAVAGLWLLCLLDIAYYQINLKGIMNWRRNFATVSVSDSDV